MPLAALGLEVGEVVGALTAAAGISLQVYQMLSSRDLAEEAARLRRDQFEHERAIALERLAALKREEERQRSGGLDLAAAAPWGLAAAAGLVALVALRRG